MSGSPRHGRTCGRIDSSTGRTCKAHPFPGERFCTGCLWQEEQDSQRRYAFDAWMRDVTRAMDRLCGLHPDDLPDCPYADWQQEDMSPNEAARRAMLRAEGKDED